VRRIFGLSFFVLGFSSLIAQVVLIRELMSSLYGNEFFIGWILFAWFLWTAVGSLIGGRIFKEILSVYRVSLTCHFLAACLFPLLIALVRSSRQWFGAAPGEIPNLLPALGVSFCLLAPFCLILGIQFAVAVRNVICRQDEIESGILMGKAYLAETLGFVAGGIFFSYLLVFVNEFTVAAIVAFANWAAMVGLFYARPSLNKRVVIVAMALLLALSAGLFAKAGGLNFRTARWRFPTESLIKTVNSVHGNVSVTRAKKQINFYQNGLWVGSDDDDVLSEYLVHFPMLAHPKPRKILLLGSGFGGVLREILKYDPERVDYVELDEEMVRRARESLPESYDRYLQDKRVRIFFEDSRSFLKDDAGQYDVVFVNVPNPSTALLNRCYTEEFFSSLRKHLSADGLVATRLDFSPNVLTAPLNNLAASVYRTLQKAFPSTLLLPEDTLFLIASPRPGWQVTPEMLIRRLSERKIETFFVVGPYIQYRMTNDRVASVREALALNFGAKPNGDFSPRAYYYNFTYWISLFHPGLGEKLAHAAWIPFRFVFGALLLLTAMPLILSLGSGARKKNACLTAMAVGGFSLMAAEVIVIYSFQIFYGNLYYKIAWIIAAFMTGMGIGAVLGTRRRHKFSLLSLFWVHLGACGFFLVWLQLLKRVFPAVALPEPAMQAVYLGLGIFIGGLIGFEFPIANKLFFRGEKKFQHETGTIYGADLIGSCLGALTVSVWWIPIYGLVKTLIFLAALNGVAALLFFVAKNLSGKNH
jgi:spermidine synthase